MKAFETEVNYKESVTMLKTQIKSLKSLIKLDKTQAATIKPIIVEKMNLLNYIAGSKTWNFNFEGGGWNSNNAKTKEKAIRLAKKEYRGSKNTIVNESTFRVATEADTKMLLSSFY